MPDLVPFGWYCRCGCAVEGRAPPEIIARHQQTFRQEHQQPGCETIDRRAYERLVRERQQERKEAEA